MVPADSAGLVEVGSTLTPPMYQPATPALTLLVVSFCTGLAPGQLLLSPTPQAEANDPFLFRNTKAVLVEDWNNDGRKDLFFANHAAYMPAQPCQVLLGTAGWRFTAGAVTSEADVAAAADFDNDGDRDIVLLITGGASAFGLVKLLRNNGGGAFTDVTASTFPYATLYGGPQCLALGDIDADGDVDLIVGHSPSLQNRLYFNNGLGVFTEGTQGHLPYANDSTTAVRLVDVDGDVDLDLVTGNQLQQSRLALNDGAGAFTDVTGTHMPSLSVPMNMIDAGDVDGDGDQDLVLGVSPNGSGHTNRLLVNDGTGHYSDQTSTRLPGWTGSSVALLDADGDQDLDVFVCVYNSACQLFANDGSGYFTNATASLLPNLQSAANRVAVADLDGDGRRDLVLACDALGWGPEPRGRNVILHNQPGGFVERIPPLDEPWGGMLPSSSLHTNALVLIDHDHDGDLDLVVGNDFGEPDRLYDNDGNGVFTDVTASRMPVTAGNTVEIAAGDVNGDTFGDLVLTWYNGQARLYLGSANGGFVDATAGRMPVEVMRSIAVALGDIDGDADLDIVFGVDGQSRVYRNNGQGFFSDYTQFALPPMNLLINAVQLVDLDGDGDRDLLTYEYGTPGIRPFSNNGSGIFTQSTFPGLPSVFFGRMVAADFDGDGDNDIFVTTAASYNGVYRLLRNNGTGTFVVGAATSGASGGESNLIAVDLDGDLDLDIVASSVPQGAVYGTNRFYLNNGTGSFTRCV